MCQSNISALKAECTCMITGKANVLVKNFSSEGREQMLGTSGQSKYSDERF